MLMFSAVWLPLVQLNRDAVVLRSKIHEMSEDNFRLMAELMSYQKRYNELLRDTLKEKKHHVSDALLQLEFFR